MAVQAEEVVALREERDRLDRALQVNSHPQNLEDSQPFKRGSNNKATCKIQAARVKGKAQSKHAPAFRSP